MPFLFVFTQLIVVKMIFFHIGSVSSTLIRASKLSASSSWIEPSIIAFSFKDG